MQKLLFVVSILFLVACEENNPELEETKIPKSSWQLVFKNDKQGKALFGNKAELLEAARNGHPIRIGWGGKLQSDSTKSLEHYGESIFVSILNGEELFVQLEQIVGQRPFFETDSLKIRFRETNRWTRMVGTNGYALGLMLEIKNDSVLSNGLDRMAKTSWYIQK